MKPEIKQRWVAALRSGEYEQGNDFLKTAGGQFCCLGVLCDLHSKETGTPWTENIYAPPFYLDERSYLPPEVMEWAGLNQSNPVIRTPDEGSLSLASRNDGGSTFQEIANLIEKEL